MSSPASFGTWISVRNVRVAESSAPAVRTTVPGKVRPGHFAEAQRDSLADGDIAIVALAGH
jgi:hypothetical protein